VTARRSRSTAARAAACLLAVGLAFSGGRLPVVSAAPADADAATWRMVVLTSPSQIAVPAPLSTASADYQTELNALKTAQSRLTTAQQRAIDEWGQGGVIRWGQLMREMVARADLPPPPLPDGTYPAPDANNPFAEPNFPFANPPYASRAYSYVSLAQFEALKACWHYKYLYGRAAPSDFDGNVRALLPTSGLPSYPSEDAVLSGVTAELLKLLFPTNIEEITREAAEQRQVAILSGRATASDVAAGLALGNAVAAVFAARAGADGMRTACVPPPARRRSSPRSPPRPRRAARSRGAAWRCRRGRRCWPPSAASAPG
jgi:hypothetical protein